MRPDWFIAMASGIVIALAMLYAALRHRGSAMPLSERMVRGLFRCAAWLDRLASTLDGAIVRYRLERMTQCIELQSTVERQSRPARRAA